MNAPGARPPRARPSLETVTAAVLLVLGAAYGVGALHEGLGSVASTGAGFFPLLVAVVLVASSAAVLVQELRHASRGTAPKTAPAAESADDPQLLVEPAEDDVDWLRVVAVLAASLAVPLLAGTVGFVVTLSAAVLIIAKVMGMPGLLRPLVLAVGFGVTTWLVFVYWLFVPLPPGVLGLA